MGEDENLDGVCGWAVPGAARFRGPNAASSLPVIPLLGLQVADGLGWDCLSNSLPGDSFGGGFSPVEEIVSPVWAFGDFDVDYERVLERRWSEHTPGSFEDVHLLPISGPRALGSDGAPGARSSSRVSANWETGHATPRPPSRNIELPPAPSFPTTCLPPSPAMSSRSAPSLSVGPSRYCSVEPETPVDEDTIMTSPARPRRALSEEGYQLEVVKPGIKRKRENRKERLQIEAQKDFQERAQARSQEGSGESTPIGVHDSETRKRLMLVNERLELRDWPGDLRGPQLYTQSATTSPRI